MRMSVGSLQIIPFLLTQNSSNWHFLVWHKPTLSQHSTAQARNPQGYFQSHESRLIVACLPTASGQLHKCSLHLILFQLVPCTLFSMVVQTFLTMKYFAAGSSTDPCHLACVSKSVPSDVIHSICCSTQWQRSAVGVMHMSRGWLLNVPFSRSSWSSWFLRRFAHEDESEQSLLAKTLEGTLCGTPQVMQ